MFSNFNTSSSSLKKRELLPGNAQTTDTFFSKKKKRKKKSFALNNAVFPLAAISFICSQKNTTSNSST